MLYKKLYWLFSFLTPRETIAIAEQIVPYHYPTTSLKNERIVEGKTRPPIIVACFPWTGVFEIPAAKKTVLLQ